MGFMEFTYRIERKEGTIIIEWIPVLVNVSLKDANAYIKSKTNGLFGERPSNYRIVKEPPKQASVIPLFRRNRNSQCRWSR